MVYIRKRVELFALLEKIKLRPSKKGKLHGIRSLNITGDKAVVMTHCNEQFIIHNSKKSKAARWLRNKWYKQLCPKCSIPDWKIEKYSATRFSKKQGSQLKQRADFRILRMPLF